MCFRLGLFVLNSISVAEKDEEEEGEWGLKKIGLNRNEKPTIRWIPNVTTNYLMEKKKTGKIFKLIIFFFEKRTNKPHTTLSASEIMNAMNRIMDYLWLRYSLESY